MACGEAEANNYKRAIRYARRQSRFAERQRGELLVAFNMDKYSGSNSWAEYWAAPCDAVRGVASM